jgi:ABC-2 type transport system ATP-binding protein
MRSADPVVRAESLTKMYGSVRGVADLTFTVPYGAVFGFLGPNGPGKTTTIRLMLDLIRPTGGSLEVFGLDPRRNGCAIRKRVGYMPGDLRLYERLTAREHLRYFASLRGVRRLDGAERLARRFDLDLDRPVRTLSRGNRQKVGLVQAFMHRPQLVLLDEPTSGLDPLMQQVFVELVRNAVADGQTVFLSSHVLSEVQRVADQVALIRNGSIDLVDSVEALRARALTRVEVLFAQPPQADAFAGLAGIEELERHGATVRFAVQGRIDPLVKALARHEILALDSHEADLEDVFLSRYLPETERAA